MTQMMVADETVKDFSRPADPIKFRVDKDVFTAAPVLPAYVALELAELAQKVKGDNDVSAADRFAIFSGLFEKVLFDDDQKKFVDRMRDVHNPISVNQLTDIMMWLLERYGLRPTEQSPDSSPGSGDQATGPTSMDGVSHITSMNPSVSPSPDSST